MFVFIEAYCPSRGLVLAVSVDLCDRAKLGVGLVAGAFVILGSSPWPSSINKSTWRASKLDSLGVAAEMS